jgi:large subunit ribosomal protein L24
MAQKIKTGDLVAVLAGKDRGKRGKVIQVFAADARVVVDGVNQLWKHVRPRAARGATQPGQKVSFFGPIAVSNVALVCAKCGKATRVGVKTLEDGKKVRTCRRCGEAIS